MRNANNHLKSSIPQWRGEQKSDSESINLYPGRITTKSVLPIGKTNHNTQFQWNRLITFMVILLTVWRNDWQANNTHNNLHVDGLDGLEVCSWCHSSLSQRPLHTRYCHLRSSASAICSNWHSTGSMCPDCNWTTKFRSQRSSHMEPSATSATITGPVGERLQSSIEDAPVLDCLVPYYLCFWRIKMLIATSSWFWRWI